MRRYLRDHDGRQWAYTFLTALAPPRDV